MKCHGIFKNNSSFHITTSERLPKLLCHKNILNTRIMDRLLYCTSFPVCHAVFKLVSHSVIDGQTGTLVNTAWGQAAWCRQPSSWARAGRHEDIRTIYIRLLNQHCFPNEVVSNEKAERGKSGSRSTTCSTKFPFEIVQLNIRRFFLMFCNVSIEIIQNKNKLRVAK